MSFFKVPIQNAAQTIFGGLEAPLVRPTFTDSPTPIFLKPHHQRSLPLVLRWCELVLPELPRHILFNKEETQGHEPENARSCPAYDATSTPIDVDARKSVHERQGPWQERDFNSYTSATMKKYMFYSGFHFAIPLFPPKIANFLPTLVIFWQSFLQIASNLNATCLTCPKTSSLVVTRWLLNADNQSCVFKRVSLGNFCVNQNGAQVEV